MEQFYFYKPFESNDFLYEKCFLCGKELSIGERADEHVFPKWLLAEFNLWDEKLTLLNTSQIPYRNLTIPCCKTCNTTHLSQMEIKFRRILERKFIDLTTDDEKVIFQWSAKILYGTLYKELSLRLDMSNPDEGNILPPEFVEKYDSLHLLLQSIRKQAFFHEPKPWSIFTFNYLTSDFDYMNNVIELCFSIKFGGIGFAISFEDNNETNRLLNNMNQLKSNKLSTIQFLELMAQITYFKKLFLNAPLYTTIYNTQEDTLEFRTSDTRKIDKWNNENYAVVFENILFKRSIILDKPLFTEGKVTTFIPLEYYNSQQ